MVMNGLFTSIVPGQPYFIPFDLEERNLIAIIIRKRTCIVKAGPVTISV